MDKVIKVLEELSKTPGRYDKEDILEANKSEEMKYLLKLAYDPFTLFGVKTFNPVVNTETPATFTDILHMADDLMNGDVIGNAAKDRLEEIISCNDELQVRWLTQIFKKNVKIGCDAKTINRIYPNLIPVFEVGLCKVVQATEKDELNGKKSYDVSLVDFKHKLQMEKWVIEPKYDGLRCLAFIDDKNEVEFLSRSGKPLLESNGEHIVAELKSLNLRNTVFDGEAYAGTWEDSVGVARSEKSVEGSNKLKFYIFDCMTLAEFDAQKTRGYTDRKSDLEDLLDDKELKYLEIVPDYTVTSIEQVTKCYEQMLKDGFEGAVLKRANAEYPFKRSADWLKWKPWYSEDLPIVGWVIGEGKHSGRLGKFFVDYKGVKVGVGGGYNDEQRENYWAGKEQMLGNIIEVKHWGITPDGSLRFPQFLRERSDK